MSELSLGGKGFESVRNDYELVYRQQRAAKRLKDKDAIAAADEAMRIVGLKSLALGGSPMCYDKIPDPGPALVAEQEAAKMELVQMGGWPL